MDRYDASSGLCRANIPESAVAEDPAGREFPKNDGHRFSLGFRKGGCGLAIYCVCAKPRQRSWEGVRATDPKRTHASSPMPLWLCNPSPSC
jgi:hypothetical protein